MLNPRGGVPKGTPRGSIKLLIGLQIIRYSGGSYAEATRGSASVRLVPVAAGGDGVHPKGESY